jgi:protein-L-isoaspartate(D-aspartate) O-methyltransferase
MPTDADTGPQVAEDEGFQRKEWATQRVAWVGFALVLLAAAIGLFGGGPLSRATRGAEGAQIEFDRFTRREKPFDLVVRLAAAGSETITVEIASEILRDVAVEGTTPTTELERSGENGGRFEFAATPGLPAMLKFRLQSSTPGLHAGTIRVDGVPLSFSTFVYP